MRALFLRRHSTLACRPSVTLQSCLFGSSIYVLFVVVLASSQYGGRNRFNSQFLSTQIVIVYVGSASSHYANPSDVPRVADGSHYTEAAGLFVNLSSLQSNPVKLSL